MFGWFRRKPLRWPRSRSRISRTDPAAEAWSASLKLGELIRRHPLAILDSATLPLPKAAMKTALKLAWERAKDDKQRSVIEAWYLRLSDFQDGVGREPIDCDPPPTADAAKTSKYLKAWLPWAELCQNEKWMLWVELTELKRQKIAAQTERAQPAPSSARLYPMRYSA